MSHDSQESYYKAVEDSDDFNLDKDASDDCDNDLLVSITSQLGGLTKHHSAIYCNTIHEGFYIKDDSEAGISSETNSTHIQDDYSAFLIAINLLMLLEETPQMVPWIEMIGKIQQYKSNQKNNNT
jgi:hypothetical protein